MASSSGQPTLRCEDYHVALICPVANLELLPARLMLDEEHPVPPYNTHYDENSYTCGTMKGHTIVIATCPQGQTGNVNAGRLTGPMFKTFPNIRMTVLIGIGGGIPHAIPSEDPLEAIHLGDVVVGWPGDGKPACVYHERGRDKVNNDFEILGAMQDPEWRLLNALGKLQSDHELGKTTFSIQLERLKTYRKFAHPGLEHDRLYKAVYHHVGGYRSKCAPCDPNELVQRPARTADDKDKLVFHLGRIATGNAVIQDGEKRDMIREKCDGALCVEMGAAGVDVNRRCLVIRGISDYADSHKSDVWRSHAAGNAAAFARELLCRIQPATVKDMQGVNEAPWLVPFVRPSSFVGRDAQLAHLSAHVSSEGGRRLAVYGLGGCGKTALALEMAYRTREQEPKRAVFWVPAISWESFEQAYREIGWRLRIPGIADNNADVKQLVKTQLSDEGRGQWLMVVDNADDDEVLFGDVDRLIDWLPHSRKGSILFTTRTRIAAIKLAEREVVELGELAEAEAREMLRKRLLPAHQQQLQDEKTVTKFLDMLAFFALAIVQAVAFVNTHDVTLSDYISDYQNSEGDAIALLGEEFEDQGRYRDSKNPVATTWYISFKQIQKENRLAADYLSFMACIVNTNVPASLLPAGGSRVEQTKALGTLKAYAFVTEYQGEEKRPAAETGKSEKLFDVHPLVHLAMRQWLKAYDQWLAWAEKTLKRLVKMVPFGNLHTREVWTIYLPHATHIVDVAEMYDLESRMSLLEKIGECERALGHYRAAESAYRQLFERDVEVLGREHPDTLICMNNVAVALTNRGKYVEAEAMHQATLAVREKVLGTEHPDTLISMNNVAQALLDRGKYVEGEAMHRMTLAVREKVLGTEHPDTLTSMNNLATSLAGQGKFVEAEAIHRATLAVEEKVLGTEHPHTLISLNNVAHALMLQGKYAEAEAMHQATLVLREKVLGTEHPDTLMSMYNVAAALEQQGKYAEAEAMHRATLVLREKISGKEHPDTLMSMNNLAAILVYRAKYTEAEILYRETLALQEIVSGTEHPHMLITMYNLARTLSEQEKYVEAEILFRVTLASRETISGKEHPDTLLVMDGLAWTVRKKKEKEKEKVFGGGDNTSSDASSGVAKYGYMTPPVSTAIRRHSQ